MEQVGGSSGSARSPRGGRGRSLGAIGGVGCGLAPRGARVTGTAPAAGNSLTPITDCSDASQLRQDVTAGGSYQFTCSGQIQIAPNPLVVTKQVALSVASG